ncbi:MAG: hypothetical protein JO341_06420, partial [Gammaproteobacteria bacterium]|nr:hypothetical protein [Gammaproteobacteria bacterium]
ATPFTSVSANGIILQLSDPHLSTAVHNIFTGPASIDLVHDLPASPLITTNGADPNSLVLAVGSNTYSGGVNVFNTSAGFETALNTALSGGAHKIYRLVALGSYRSVTNTFVADTIDVALQP